MSTTLFKEALKLILELEGIYSDDKEDKGGRTKFGITEKVAREYGWKESMLSLPLYMAEKIYYDQFWQKANLSKISEISPAIAVKLFETSINCGTRRAIRWFQKSLNSLKLSSFLEVDGLIGKKTIKAFITRQHYLDHVTILKMINTYQSFHYINICNADHSQKKFIRGWFRRINWE
jgi:lysozyme family protein